MSSGRDDAEATYIQFVAADIPRGQKTERWLVGTKDGAGYLGQVKWFGRWRKYSFFPAMDCVFEEVCLREIAQFIQDRTREKRVASADPPTPQGTPSQPPASSQSPSVSPPGSRQDR